ncbi:MAG: DUF3048 domain-containing protein [bacterium]|nr:DUF3048 domain-containing protein [bacterium]
MKELIAKLRKKPLALAGIVAGVLVIAAIVIGFLVFGGEKTVSGEGAMDGNTNDEVPGGYLLSRKIDGVHIARTRENFQPVAVMVENLVASRPQAGLDTASLVYEALAEGGITRFMAVYASGDQISKIGPVRSARDYYLDWVKELNAVYAHIGGSPQAFQLIPQYDILDLNQFYNSQYFWRDDKRFAPHNLYTSSELLDRAVRDKDFPEQGDFESWVYASEEDPVGESGQTLTIDFSTYSYETSYVYDRETNEYQRFQAGEPHIMENGAEIHAKNVIVQFVKVRIADAENRLNQETIGEGEARVYTNGREITGTWKKETLESRTRYFDSSNNEIELNPGKTWVAVVPTDRGVTYE